MKKAQLNKANRNIVINFIVSSLALLGFLVVYVFYRLNVFPELPVYFQKEFVVFIRTVYVICVAYGLQRISGLVLGWYGNNIAPKTLTKTDDKIIPLLSKMLKVTLWVIALLIILPAYGVNVSVLVATLGVSSLAIALAAQDTIANIISGFLIMIDAPFRPGDIIALPSGERVRVLSIGLRRSVFLSEDKATVIIVPNVDLSKNKIVNFTLASDYYG